MNRNKIENSIKELSDLLLPKLPNSKQALEYVDVGELLLALEMLSDWCIDAEPSFKLTASELIKFKESSDLLGVMHPWAELLPILAKSEYKLISKKIAINASEYVTRLYAENPARKAWLEKIESVVKDIETSV